MSTNSFYFFPFIYCQQNDSHLYLFIELIVLNLNLGLLYSTDYHILFNFFSLTPILEVISDFVRKIKLKPDIATSNISVAGKNISVAGKNESIFSSNSVLICSGLVFFITWKNIYDCQLSIKYSLLYRVTVLYFFTKNSLWQAEFSDFNFFVFQNSKKEIEANELLTSFIYFSV